LKFKEYLHAYSTLKNELLQSIQSKIEKLSKEFAPKNLNDSRESHTVLKAHSDEQIRQVIYKNLQYLNGVNANQQKIMNSSRFEALISDLCQIVKLYEVPQGSGNYVLNGISGNAFRFSLYLIHSELFGTNKIRDSFIKYIMNFKQFSNTSFSTHKTKFSQKPKKYPF
jgi:hypothetical protein